MRLRELRGKPRNFSAFISVFYKYNTQKNCSWNKLFGQNSLLSFSFPSFLTHTTYSHILQTNFYPSIHPTQPPIHPFHTYFLCIFYVPTMCLDAQPMVMVSVLMRLPDYGGIMVNKIIIQLNMQIQIRQTFLEKKL